VGGTLEVIARLLRAMADVAGAERMISAIAPVSLRRVVLTLRQRRFPT